MKFWGTDSNCNRFNYSSQTKTGHLLRSSSVYFKNSKGEVIGAFCINFDFTELLMAEKLLAMLTHGLLDLGNKERQKEINEIFANGVNRGS